MGALVAADFLCVQRQSLLYQLGACQQLPAAASWYNSDNGSDMKQRGHSSFHMVPCARGAAAVLPDGLCPFGAHFNSVHRASHLGSSL